MARHLDATLSCSALISSSESCGDPFGRKFSTGPAAGGWEGWVCGFLASFLPLPLPFLTIRVHCDELSPPSSVVLVAIARECQASGEKVKGPRFEKSCDKSYDRQNSVTAQLQIRLCPIAPPPQKALQVKVPCHHLVFWLLLQQGWQRNPAARTAGFLCDCASCIQARQGRPSMLATKICGQEASTRNGAGAKILPVFRINFTSTAGFERSRVLLESPYRVETFWSWCK